MPTKISQVRRSNLSAPLKRKYADNNLLAFDNNTNFTLYLFRPHFRLKERKMFKKLLYTWLFKGLEIVLVALLGYGIYLIIDGIFAKFWAICGLTIIMYYWAILTKPYIDSLRKWIYKKIIKDEEDI